LGEAHPDTARSLQDIGVDLTALAQYGQAEAVLRQALQIRRQRLGPDHVDTADSYDALGRALFQDGKLAEAEAAYHAAIDIDRKVLGEDAVATAYRYNDLALCLNAQGRFSEAEPLLRKDLAIAKAKLGDDSPATAMAYDFLGQALNGEGRYVEAEAALRQGLAAGQKAGGDKEGRLALISENLGVALLNERRLTEAEALFRKNLALALRVAGDKARITATAYTNLAVVLTMEGRAAEATPLLQKALAVNLSWLGDNHPDTATSYTLLAANLRLQGRYADALPLSRQGAAIFRNFRAARSGQGATGAAGALARLVAGDGHDDQLSFAFIVLMETDFGLAAQAPAETSALRGEAFLAAQDLDVSQTGAAMAQAAARAAAGDAALMDLVRRQQDLALEVKRLDAAATSALVDQTAQASDAAKTQRDQKLSELAALDEQLRTRFPRYADLVSPASLDLGAVQSRLGQGQGLLLIVPTRDDVFSFAVSRTSVAWSRAADGAKRTALRVKTLLCDLDAATCAAGPKGASNAVVHPAPGAGFDYTAAFGLYHDLIEPLEGALTGISRLYVTTSGPLSSLPLGVLVTKDPQAGGQGRPAGAAPSSWLADKYAMTTLPAISSLRPLPTTSAKDAPKAGRKAPQAFVGYGAPSLLGKAQDQGVLVAAVRSSGAEVSVMDPDSLRTRLEPLPGAAVELHALAAAAKAGPGSVHIGADDTETAVKRDGSLAQARVIAFATHGLMPGERVRGLSEPGLVFTPPQVATIDDDGVLTASEVTRMHFDADWIILSACNTASADGSSGADGLSTLSRAFLYAGARALLASHWRVADDVTAALTVETLTLRSTHPGLSRADALQLAMRSVRTGVRQDGTRLEGWSVGWSDPAAWGPFSVISDADP
jgi:CHAT domain-containing protein